jgi:hypothetical protein
MRKIIVLMAIINCLVFFGQAQPVTIKMEKKQYRIVSPDLLTKDRLYDTLFFLPISKSHQMRYGYEEGMKPSKGFYVGVSNWNHSYKNFTEWESEIKRPLYNNATYDLFTEEGFLINKNAMANNVLINRIGVGCGSFFSIADTSCKTTSFMSDGDSLEPNSFVIVKHLDKYMLYDFLSGKSLLPTPVDQIIAEGSIPRWFKSENKWGYIDPIKSLMIPAEYDTIINKGITTNVPKKSLRRLIKYEYLEGDVSTPRFSFFGQQLRVCIKSMTYKDTTYAFQYTFERNGMLKDTTEHFSNTLITAITFDVYNSDFKKLNAVPINDMTYFNFWVDEYSSDRIFASKSNLVGSGKGSISSLCQGLMLPVNSKFEFYNGNLNKVLPFTFDDAYPLVLQGKGYLVIERENKHELYDLFGKKITMNDFDSIWTYNYPDSTEATGTNHNRNFQFAFFKSNSKTGVLSLETGEIIVPCNFDFIWYDPNAKLFVVNNGAKLTRITIDTLTKYGKKYFEFGYNDGTNEYRVKTVLPIGGRFGIYDSGGKCVAQVKYAWLNTGSPKPILYSSAKLKQITKYVPMDKGYFFNPLNDFTTYSRLFTVTKGKITKP